MGCRLIQLKSKVYISDLASHHGTHIQRPGESVPKTVPSEYPTVLADGDTLTFGKPVGKESSLVHPVTARVHLLFSIPSTSSTPAQASTTPMQLTSPAAATTPTRTGSSGRYGMYTPAMTSSGSDSSSEDEIEEIPPPPPQPQLPPCSSFAGLPWGWPVSSFQHHPFQQPQLMQHPHHMHRADPVQVDGGGPGRLHLLRRILPRLGSVEEISSHRGSTRMSPISISSDSRSSSEVVEVAREDAARDPSESTTGESADVLRPSRAASPLEDAGEDMELESVAPSEYPVYREGDFLDMSFFGAKEAAGDAVALLIASSRICTPEPASPRGEEESDDSSDMYATPAPQPAPVDENILNAPALAAVVPAMPFPWLDGELALDVAPQAEAQFESRVESLKSKLADLEQRMFVPEQAAPVEAEPEVEAEQLVEVQKPVETKQTAEAEPAAEIEPVQVVNDSAATEAVEIVSAPEMTSTLKDMLEGKPLSPLLAYAVVNSTLVALEVLRKKAEADMAHELAAIRVARAEAEAALAAAREAAARPTVEVSVRGVGASREAHTAQAAGATEGRKRKRGDDGEDGHTAAAGCQAVFDRLTTEPPRKRARAGIAKRVAVGVAKTTAIAAVGAVAAWSALAFS